MRGSQLVRLAMIAVALLGTIASGVLATGSVCLCFDSAFRVGGGVTGFPVSSGDLRLEGAIGLPELSLAVWTSIDGLPSIASTVGGELKLAEEWLSLSLSAGPGESQMKLSLKGQATPPAWLLVDSVPTLIGGITAIAETELLKSVGRSEITLSPFLTGVIPAGDTVVSPSIGLDLSLDSENQVLAVSGSRLISTVSAGCVLIANTVHFTGLFDAFSSLVVSINVPDWGLTVSGSLLPTGAGGFSYRVSVGYEWGDTYLLSVLTGKPGTTCTGDVCF